MQPTVRSCAIAVLSFAYLFGGIAFSGGCGDAGANWTSLATGAGGQPGRGGASPSARESASGGARIGGTQATGGVVTDGRPTTGDHAARANVGGNSMPGGAGGADAGIRRGLGGSSGGGGSRLVVGSGAGGAAAGGTRSGQANAAGAQAGEMSPGMAGGQVAHAGGQASHAGGQASHAGGQASHAGGQASHAGGSRAAGGGIDSGRVGAAGAGAGGSTVTKPTGGAGGNVSAPPALTASVTVHIAGDSTACVFPATDGRVGWGSVLQQFFATGVTVDDAAQSGRSSKSFLDEGLWNKLKVNIKSGDYVFIQFGHNDEKTDDPARYTDPATTFRDNLKVYINDSRTAGGYPVLLTPISRRQFSGNKIKATHGDYPAAVLAVGRETGAPVIDMTERTRVWLEALGPDASIPMFATDDNTHLSAKGAPEVAKLAVQGLRDLALPLLNRLK